MKRKVNVALAVASGLLLFAISGCLGVGPEDMMSNPLNGGSSSGNHGHHSGRPDAHGSNFNMDSCAKGGMDMHGAMHGSGMNGSGMHGSGMHGSDMGHDSCSMGNSSHSMDSCAGLR